ncbi:hypothetical protein [Zooshikella harenae]|uniref:Uncharacterized protein n=1 Tax=Zooshikella harenae TaxID=2827238 RepID=A0ABS5ZH94_9GAMM|nr:hypothetical protein [Zooshikella harenae]MBU2713369.1 hypothetical protein [Zooshikella harenae]
MIEKKPVWERFSYGYLYRESKKRLRNFHKLCANIPISDKELFVAIDNRLKVAAQVIKRDNSFFGHLFNRFLFEKVGVIDITGNQLKRLLELAGQQPVEIIDIARDYEIDYGELVELLEKALLIVN